MYLLDTDICIYIIKKQPLEMLQKLKIKFKKGIFISSITIAQLECGIAKSKFPEKNKIALIEFLSIFNILTYDEQDAAEFGILKANLESSGKIIGPMDLLIASQAKAKNLILVTNNTTKFKRINELNIENWLN